MIPPSRINTKREANPQRCDADHCVVVATRSGARKAVIEPERPYSPKNWVARSGGEMRAINVLEAESAVTKKSAKTWFVAK